MRKAITFLQEAVRLDSNYALAYAKLSQASRRFAASFAWTIIQSGRRSPPRRSRAVSLAPDLVDARMAVGLLAMNPGLDFPAAEKELGKSCNPPRTTLPPKMGSPFPPGSRSIYRGRGSLSTGTFVRPSLLTNLWLNVGRITAEPAVTRKPGKRFAKDLNLADASLFSYLPRHARCFTKPSSTGHGEHAIRERRFLARLRCRFGATSARRPIDGRRLGSRILSPRIERRRISDRCIYAIRKEPDEMFKWLDAASPRSSGLSQLAVTPFFLPFATSGV